MDSFEAEFVKAYEDIETYSKVNPAEAEEYYDRVSILKVGVINLQCLLHRSSYTREEYVNLVNWLSSAVAKYNIVMYGEGVSISQRIQQLESKIDV